MKLSRSDCCSSKDVKGSKGTFPFIDFGRPWESHEMEVKRSSHRFPKCVLSTFDAVNSILRVAPVFAQSACGITFQTITTASDKTEYRLQG